MPLSTETAATLASRRARLVELLTLPLSHTEIERTLGLPSGTVSNDINVLRKSGTMPERPADMSYAAKLRLYHHALKHEVTVENGYCCHFAPNQDTEQQAMIIALRDSLDIRTVVKHVNLMLKGVAMQRMPKLPKELWRAATIWRLALRSYGVENGVDHGLWHSYLKPAPHVATFTVESLEKRFALFNTRTNVSTAKNSEEFAERFVAFLEFRAEPSNGLVMTPTEVWEAYLVRADLVITETTRDLIEGIIGEHCTHDVVIMLNMLAPRDGSTGMTIEEIAQEFSVTRERVRQALTKALRVIGVQLRRALHIGATERGVDVTDAARILHIGEVEELHKQLHIAVARLAERTEMLVTHGLLSVEKAAPEGIDVIGEEAFAHLCKRMDELDLSVRTANCFSNANIEFIWQIVEKTEGELLKVKNFGSRSLNEIRDVLSELGLSLGMKIPAIVRVRFPKS